MLIVGKLSFDAVGRKAHCSMDGECPLDYVFFNGMNAMDYAPKPGEQRVRLDTVNSRTYRATGGESHNQPNNQQNTVKFR